MKILFFIWLNDTTHSRYYWSQPAQNWTTDFSHATTFDKRIDAETEAQYADLTTKAEVCIQEWHKA